MEEDYVTNGYIPHVPRDSDVSTLKAHVSHCGLLITNKAYQYGRYYQNIAVASLPSPSKYLGVLSCLMEDQGFVSHGVLEFVSQSLGKFL